MNKKYNLKLDLQFRCNNSIMKFNQFDNNTSDFFMRITNGGKLVDIEKAIVVLAVIKPSGKVASQFVEVKNGLVYADLKPSMKDEIGTYTAQAMLILEDERVVTDVISYEVEEDKIFSLLNDTVETTEEFTLLTDMLSRLSTIETSEDNRKNNFSKIQEEFEAIKNNHNELVTTQTSKRVDEIIQPVVEENVKKHTEKVINELSDKVVIVDSKIEEVEEFIENKNSVISNTITNANNKVDEAISKIPPKSELIGPKGDKGDRGERGERGLQGIQGLQGPIGKTGATGPQGERGEQGLQGPIGEQGPIGPQGEKGDTPSIAHLETSINNKINDVETRFNALTSSQQQDAEVIDARDGETSLKARLDRDIEKAKQVYVNVEGSNISTDSSVGYAKDVEILGNTIQSASNLADIRSVGDTVEGQELYEIPVVSCGKNLLTNKLEDFIDETSYKKITINLEIGKDYILSTNCPIDNGSANLFIGGVITNTNGCWNNAPRKVVGNRNIDIYIKKSFVSGTFEDFFNGRYYIQLEEGTVATPYEPYIEDKLTILSPVQLEKVGDVADRIIEKDGVWGVEKWTTVKQIPNNLYWMADSYDTETSNTFWCNATGLDVFTERKRNEKSLYHKKLNSITRDEFEFSDKLGISTTTNGAGFFIRTPKNVYVDTVNDYIAKNGREIVCTNNTPQFIPLPHDQQIKLRTFANKTNISFLTEIEGTIKAQVPKSLGATVNTHTEQIRSLNNELNRVKKLEESTVSTITTESDFTTVEATNGGYFEDVKLEGKTLVNLCKKNTVFTGTPPHAVLTLNKDIEIGNTYTLITYGLENKVKEICLTDSTGNIFALNYTVYKNTISFEAKDKVGRCYVKLNNGVVVSDLIDTKFFILEGDHTQNPPSYFEGLKSVGQSTSEDGVDEIVVSSVKGDGNLFNKTLYYNLNTKFDIDVEGYSVKNIKLKPNTEYTIHGNNNVNGLILISKNKQVNTGWIYDFRESTVNPTQFTTDSTGFIYIGCYGVEGNKVNEILDNSTIQIEEGTVATPYKSYVGDKKRLLYYNEETQTWEKPILREWDSIEKHANGKYYYHQRSGEVVLNGSESWYAPAWSTHKSWTSNNPNGFAYETYISIAGKSCDTPVICNKFNSKSIPNSSNLSIGYCVLVENYLSFATNVQKTVEQWKSELQANNVTVVYQLAQEKVYECTNIDLITYANETNYVVSSGVIIPKTTLKVHNNISNVVSLLQKKVSLLESNVKASQEVQDMMILETDMRMLDIELALMEFVPMTLNLGGSDMLRSATYFNFLKNHIINETYEKGYLENVMNKYLATGRINQDEYDELYKMLYPPVYDIELPIEY